MLNFEHLPGRVMQWLTLCLVCCLPLAAHANPQSTNLVEVEFFPEWETVPSEGGEFWVAMRQKIAPVWHTYYKNPGASGEKTTITWTLPDSVSAGDIQWPYPHRLPYGPLVNFGYEGSPVFLVRMTAGPDLEAGQDLTFNANVYWLVCSGDEETPPPRPDEPRRGQCIPQSVDVSFSMPVADGPPQVNDRSAPVIAGALSSLPQPSPWPVVYQADSQSFTVGVKSPETIGAFENGSILSAEFFPDQPGVIDASSDQDLRYGSGGFSVVTKTDAVLAQSGKEPPARVAGLIVLKERSNGDVIERAITFDAERAEIPADLGTNPLTAGGGGGPGGGIVDLSLGQAMVFAFLGGIILNLMPCVFPVLFMKALGFVSAAHEEKWVLRSHGLVFTAGVVVSFLVVAGTLLALRAGGAQIGWGFQLQSPIVITVLCYLLFLVGLNLSGVFSVGQSITGLGNSLAAHSGYSGSFFTGVLATVVATPCTAPFMAAAVGFALTQPAYATLGIFLFLGLGMASPWLALSFLPALLKLLPKPGAWMERLKELLAFPMYATVGWLAWVLVLQVGADGLIVVVGGCVLLGFAAWAFNAVQNGGGKSGVWSVVGLGSALISLAGAVFLVATALPQAGAGSTAAPVSSSSSSSAISYQTYDPAAVEAARAEGKPVFMNFTAAWCISCLVNERVALSDPAVVARFKALEIVAFKGDWTNRDAEILETLRSFGRSGVPLYVYYPPATDGSSDALVLPQVLTPGIVLDVLRSE